MNFEEYLQKMLETHAWRVEPAGMSSPTGVSLIIHKEPYRYAVIVQDHAGTLGPEAVHRARKGADEYFCTHAAIISQGDFSDSAKREAMQDPPVALVGRSDFFHLAKILEQPMVENNYVAPRKPFPVIPVLMILGALMVGGGGVWYLFFDDAPMPVVTASVQPTPTPAPGQPGGAPAPPAQRTPRPPTPDNKLTDEEVTLGWVALFDGGTGRGWTNSDRKSARVKVEQNALNPFDCGENAIFTKSAYGDFEMHIDYKISPGFVGGIVVRQFPLDGGDGYRSNGLEICISDVYDGSFEAAGALRDLVQPTANAAKPAGEWNSIDILAQKEFVSVTLNGQQVSQINLRDWNKPHERPDGSRHRLNFPIGKRSKIGYLALPKGSGQSWYKNIRVRKLDKLGM